jgi:hypothetical protein
VELTTSQVNELRECLELLLAVEIIEYHNKNWLAQWAIEDTPKVCREKLHLVNRALSIVGSSSSRNFAKWEKEKLFEKKTPLKSFEEIRKMLVGE